MNKNHVVWRKYIKGKLKTISPLIIGSGEDNIHDIQCIKDIDGKPFIPGTSVAGVLRSLFENGNSENEDVKRKILFGESGEEGRQSLFIFHDCFPDKKDNDRPFSVRDGICIDESTGTVKPGAKYDFEVIDKDSSFDFRMEVYLREKDVQKGLLPDAEKLVDEIIADMVGEYISFGAKTSRGFGKVQLINPPQSVTFDFRNEETRKEEAEKWLSFGWSSDLFESMHIDKDAKKPFGGGDSIAISAAFDIPGGILIRSYPTDPSGPDAVHLMSGTSPVIPGTSWAGVLKTAILNVGRDLNKLKNMKSLNKEIFGNVNTKKEEDTSPSSIIIDESEIVNGYSHPYMRNKIDRFTGGVVSSSLFTEKPNWGGHVEFNCRIGKNKCKDKQANQIKAMVGAVVLGLFDIGNGIQPVGGTSSVGRGILHVNSIKINDDIVVENHGEYGAEIPSENSVLTPYLNALGQYLMKEKGDAR